MTEIENIIKQIENLPTSDVIVTQDGEEYDVSGIITEDLKFLAAAYTNLRARYTKLMDCAMAAQKKTHEYWTSNILYDGIKRAQKQKDE